MTTAKKIICSILSLLIFKYIERLLILHRKLGGIQQIRSALQRTLKRLLSPPKLDVGMMSAQQYIRHLPAAEFRRARVMRIL
ncbi:hypothetical protein D3C81_2040590 [compost metagenome]